MLLTRDHFYKKHIIFAQLLPILNQTEKQTTFLHFLCHIGDCWARKGSDGG